MSDELKVVEPPSSIRMMGFNADSQGCGYIRVIYPYIMLPHYKHKYNYKFDANYLTQFVNDPKFYKSFTFVQFQRSATESHKNLFKHFIKNIKPLCKTPVLYEIDDLLVPGLDGTLIPNWNYSSSYYNNNTKEVIEMLKMVDGITVSTEYLKQVYGEFNNNITVIPNHLPKILWGNPTPKHLNKPREHKPRILWPGSENHMINIKTPEYAKGVRGGDFSSNLMNFIRKTTDIYQWVLSGACPIELFDLRDNGQIEFHKWVSILEYPAHVHSLDADIFIAPLMKCAFNSSKSNIKALEAVAIGVPGVYSNIEPYADMTLTSNTDDEMIGQIEMLAKDLDYRRDVYENDHSVVREQLFWEEYDNIGKYIGKYLELFGKKLKE